MNSLLTTKLKRLRIIGFLEGLSLLVLVFIAMPMKYFLGYPGLSKTLGPIHGAIFLLFLFNALSAGVEYKWKLSTTTKLLIACFIPFGTFYIDAKILSRMNRQERN